LELSTLILLNREETIESPQHLPPVAGFTVFGHQNILNPTSKPR